MGTLLGRKDGTSSISNLLKRYQDLRKPRAVEVKFRSGRELDIFSMPDGVEQEERDRLLLEGSSLDSLPVSLLNPTFREWLWNYDAIKEASKVGTYT